MVHRAPETPGAFFCLVFVEDTDRLIDFREKTVKLCLDFRCYRDEFSSLQPEVIEVHHPLFF